MVPLSPDTSLHYVNTIDSAAELKRWLGERKRSALGLDIETSGIDRFSSESRVRTIQVGDTETGWVIPVEGWLGVALEVLNAWDGKIALHNASFDIPWLQQFCGYTVPPEKLIDTMIMARINYPGLPADLKGLAVQHIDPNADAGQKDLAKAFKTNGWDWNSVPTDFPAYWVYSALDPVLTVHLAEFLDTEAKHPEVYELEMAVLKIAMEMERRGSRVDIEYSERKRLELVEFAESNKQWAADNWGINLSSSGQVVDFFQKNGAHITRKTKLGAPSVDKEMLAILSNSPDKSVSTIANFILDTKRALKFATAYFGNFVDMSHDGLLHPRINTIQARTSRMSISDPALQQVPSKDSLVRNAFIPRNPGEQIVSVDYSQVELRILANLTGDPGLIRDFHDVDSSGGDFFANMGKGIYNDPSFDKNDGRRGLVKSAMYGMNYGASAAKIAETAKRPVEEMTQVLNGIFSAYPGIKQFQRDTIQSIEGLERSEGVGYITTSMGRVIPVDQGKAYMGVNYSIQAPAAEVMKRALVRLDSAGLTEYMMLPIHDEVVSSVPAEDVKDYIRVSEEVMAEYDHDVPLIAEGEGGFARWGEKYQ